MSDAPPPPPNDPWRSDSGTPPPPPPPPGQPGGQQPAYGQQGGYGQPPGYGQAPYGQPYAGGPKPNNFLVPAIISLVVSLCGCVGIPFGIVAIVFAAQVDGKYNGGDYAGAEKAAKNARLFTFITFGLAALTVIGWFGLAFIGSFAPDPYMYEVPE